MVDINISNKTFFIIALIGVLFIVTGFSYAAWSDKAVSHSAGDIKINIGGSDYSLQEAVNDNKITTKDYVDNAIPSTFVEEGKLIWFGNVSKRMKDGAYISKKCTKEGTIINQVISEAKIENGKLYTRARLYRNSKSPLILRCDSDWVEGREASCPDWYNPSWTATTKAYESGLQTGGMCGDFGGIWE